MESRFGAVIIEEGLGSMGITAAARLAFDPSQIITNNRDAWQYGIAQVVKYTPIGGGTDVLGYSGLPQLTTKFPYGWDVV